MQVIRLTP